MSWGFIWGLEAEIERGGARSEIPSIVVPASEPGPIIRGVNCYGRRLIHHENERSRGIGPGSEAGTTMWRY
jgi:hypothetical protein